MLLETVTDLSNSTEQKSWLVARSNHSEYLDHHVVSLEIQLLLLQVLNGDWVRPLSGAGASAPYTGHITFSEAAFLISSGQTTNAKET